VLQATIPETLRYYYTIDEGMFVWSYVATFGRLELLDCYGSSWFNLVVPLAMFHISHNWASATGKQAENMHSLFARSRQKGDYVVWHQVTQRGVRRER
jgi:hypothetical protein